MKEENVFMYRLQSLVQGRYSSTFEDKLLLSSTLFISLFQLMSVVFNLLMGLEDSIVFTSILGFLIFMILYLILRLIDRSKYMYFITGVVMLFFIDLVWLVNYGSKGPVLQFFIVLFSFIILIFHRKYYLYITLIFILNVIVLFIYETFIYDVVGSYPDNQTRLLDNYLGFFISITIVLSFLSTIKQNYIQEYKRAKMSDQLKSAFLANMSHEIRTPLNAIVGFSSLMSDPDLSEEDRKLFGNQVVHNSDYLLNLIEDIIDVSKIESNQLTVKIQEIDVVPVLSQIVQSFQLSVLSGKNVTVKCSMDMPQIIVKVDKVRFEQILRNLLSNAVKFTEDGIIEVTCQRVDEFYTFSVRDTGIGIHSDHHEEIFDRFIKIDNNKQHLYRGTGIGLFLSKQLVEMFGGNIWLESEVGEGSTFYFTIPV
jgi:signal transduction histidine kinase